MQLPAYADCLAPFGKACRWVGFLDIDEFFLPVRENDLRVFLSEFEQYGGMAATWHLFNSSGHLRRPVGPVIKNYTEAFRPAESFQVKCLVQPSRTVSPQNPYFFKYVDGYYCVNEDHYPLSPLCEPCFSSGDRLRVNHYFLRSQQDFEEKLQRDRADTDEESSRHGLAMFYNALKHPYGKDKTIQRFLPRLEAVLEENRLPNVSPPPSPPAADYETLMELALKFLDAENFEKAPALLCHALEEHREKADFWTLRAMLAMEAGGRLHQAVADTRSHHNRVRAAGKTAMSHGQEPAGRQCAKYDHTLCQIFPLGAGGASMPEQLIGFGMASAAALAGFWLFRSIRFPAAAMLGSMAATALLNIMSWVPHFNGGLLSFVCAVGIGIFLGRQINRKVFYHAKRMIRPVLVQIVCLLLLSLGCGYVFYLITRGLGIPLGTALVSTSTGGLTEMLVFGLSIGGDVGVIAFVQLFRIVTFLTLIPYSSKLAKRLGDRRKPLHGEDSFAVAAFSRLEYALLVIVGFAGGYTGFMLRIPAGSLLGAMCFSAALGMILNKKYEYRHAIRYMAQIGLGMVMGQRIDANILSRLAELFFPVLGTTAVMLFACLLLAFIQYKTTKYDLATCLMCSAPAGLSQIAIYAEEAGADVFAITVFHTARLMSIVILYPWIIMYLI